MVLVFPFFLKSHTSSLKAIRAPPPICAKYQPGKPLETFLFSFYIQGSVHREIYANNCPTTSNNMQFIYICKLLYMFRVVSPPIIRRSCHCIHSNGLSNASSSVVCDCCWLTVCIVVVVLYMCCYLMCICCTFFTLDAGLLARSQYSEGPATGHLDTGFSWFPCVYKQMLRRFPRFQVATTCFSCSPPDLNLLATNFMFCIHVK